MDVMKAIRNEWESGLPALELNPFFRSLREGRFTRDHYAMFLREEYFNTLENPEALALMTFHLRATKRRKNKTMLRHAMAECGHNLMALDDLAVLGFRTDGLPGERPLPTTESYIAFFTYQIQHRNPLAFLAYVYHLESIAVAKGPEVVGTLMSLGIPGKAMTFLTEHAEVDTVHTRWVGEYLTDLVQDDSDLEDVLYGVRGAMALHGVMLRGIMEAVDGSEPAWSRLSAHRKLP